MCAVDEQINMMVLKAKSHSVFLRLAGSKSDWERSILGDFKYGICVLCVRI